MNRLRLVQGGGEDDNLSDQDRYLISVGIYGLFPESKDENGRCTHPPKFCWLTKGWTKCGCSGCGMGSSWEFSPDFYEAVRAVHPKVHCNHWQRGDDRTKYHGKACALRSAGRAEAKADLRRMKMREV